MMVVENDEKKKTNSTKKKTQNRNGKRYPNNNRGRNGNRRNYKSSSKAKKPTSKPSVKKEATVKPVEIKEPETKEEQLEKTIIFDGTQNKNLNEVIDKIEEENVILDDKIIKRSNVKRTIIIILFIAIIATIIATVVYVVDFENNHVLAKSVTESTTTLNSNIYQKVENIIKNEGRLTANIAESSKQTDEINYSNIKTVSLKDLEQKIMNKDDIIVLIASINCYHCLNFEPVINDVFNENNKIIYRLNIASLTKDEINRFRTYYAFTATPTIFHVKDGYVKDEVVGTLTNEELNTWLNNNI